MKQETKGTLAIAATIIGLVGVFVTLVSWGISSVEETNRPHQCKVYKQKVQDFETCVKSSQCMLTWGDFGEYREALDERDKYCGLMERPKETGWDILQ